MQSLEKVQKTIKILRIFFKICMIVCIVSASLSASLALCAITWRNGGKVFDIVGIPLEPFITGDLTVAYVSLLSVTFIFTVGAVLSGLAKSYCKFALSEGTPFTEKCADRLKTLGITCIYVPFIAIAVSISIGVITGVKDFVWIGNFATVITGVILIAVSQVLRYGADSDGNLVDNRP